MSCQFYLSIITTVATLVSLFIAARAMCISAKALEEATRPVISVYGHGVAIDIEILYLVVKNTGNSQAMITRFSAEPSLSNCFPVGRRNYLDDLVGMTIAPGQSVIFALEYNTVPDRITFRIAYESRAKKYKDIVVGNIKVGVNAPKSVPVESGKELQHISQALHELVRKNL